MKPEKFMPLVKEICNIEATDCRSLNKSETCKGTYESRKHSTECRNL